MLKKVLNIMSSVRFWIIVLTAILALLNGADFIPTVQYALSAVVALGSLDSFGKKLAGK